jgi:hypothetical protein
MIDQPRGTIVLVKAKGWPVVPKVTEEHSLRFRDKANEKRFLCIEGCLTDVFPIGCIESWISTRISASFVEDFAGCFILFSHRPKATTMLFAHG